MKHALSSLRCSSGMPRSVSLHLVKGCNERCRERCRKRCSEVCSEVCSDGCSDGCSEIGELAPILEDGVGEERLCKEQQVARLERAVGDRRVMQLLEPLADLHLGAHSKTVGIGTVSTQWQPHTYAATGV